MFSSKQRQVHFFYSISCFDYFSYFSYFSYFIWTFPILLVSHPFHYSSLLSLLLFVLLSLLLVSFTLITSTNPPLPTTSTQCHSIITLPHSHYLTPSTLLPLSQSQALTYTSYYFPPNSSFFFYLSFTTSSQALESSCGLLHGE